MNKLLIATNNPGKIIELTNLLSGLPVHILSLSDIGIADDVEEKGETYEENSQAKALFYSQKSGLPAISDDGGLEINALGGSPGIPSRRWLGYVATDEELVNHIRKVTMMLPETNRTAYFRTVVSFALPDGRPCLPAGRVWSAEGKVKGIIAKKPHLKMLKGYPFRSFFFLPQINKYYHESDLSEEEQKLYNHRYKAIEKLKPIIMQQLSLRGGTTKQSL